MASDDADVFAFQIGARVFAVLSLPADVAPAAAPLTAAEQDVMRLALAGWSNRRIAGARRTSERTVANQMASLFRKLGVASRGELAAYVLRGRACAPR